MIWEETESRRDRVQVVVDMRTLPLELSGMLYVMAEMRWKSSICRPSRDSQLELLEQLIEEFGKTENPLQ